MKNVTTIFFDFDNTLVDDAFARRQAMVDTYERFRAVFHQIPLDVLDHTFEKENDQLWAQLSRGEISAEELRTQRFIRTLQALFTLTPLIKYDHRDAFEIDPFFVARYEVHTREMPGATETLRTLGKQFTLGVLTNGLRDIQQRRLNALGWSELFTHIITPDEVQSMKPNDQFFEAAEAVSQRSAKEILFVGDSHHYDVAPAKRRGWSTVWFNPMGESIPENLADVEVQSLRDIVDLFVTAT